MDLSGSPVFVTGGTGFIGSHLARALADAGAEVRLLVRRTSSLRWLEGVPHRRLTADLAEGDDLSEALDGVRFVFHLAGVLRASRHADFQRGNVEATRHLVASARRMTPRPKIVLLSSLAAAGPSTAGRPLRELDPPRPVGPYGKSKLRAEQAARQEADGVPIAILRPPLVYGPREGDFLGACRAVRRGLLPHVGHRRRTLSVIHVRDLVQAIIDAAGRAPDGGVYFVAHREVLSWEDVLAGIASALGKRGLRIVLPDAIVPAIAAGSEILSQLTGKESILNRQRTLEWRHRHWVCDPSRAEREWGFRAPTAYRDGVRETLDWYVREGWL